MRLSNKNTKGLTLVEIMISIVIILVAIVGAMSFRYYTAMDAREADVKVTAARIGGMLLDGWKAKGGDTTYDPDAEFSSNLDISTCVTGPAVPTGYTELDTYLIVSNRANLYATLSYEGSTTTAPGILNVKIAWLHNYTTGTVGVTDKSVQLTAFVRN